MKRLVITLAGLLALTSHAATLARQWQIADEPLAEYFRRETRAISERCLTDLTTSNAWLASLPGQRTQLAEMLGLAPMPPRTDLRATVTKRLEHDTFTVENLHFQSRPGLYVTANLYVPKNLTKPAPAVLYVSGHGPVVTNGISYGNKVSYQHHGAWFARNGYVCLILDTVQLGEISGVHHGTYREGMWWWNSRGYTPAGVECWNGMRALDYLSTRPEVDTNRFGVTGRSGGGAYSWFVTAMDERIKAAAPVAGITDLENHVVDGAVEGHCDCMFFVNTYRWDYPQLAALAAPRPLLIVNTDDDSLFPLDGVVRLRDKVRRVYDLLGAGEKCGLVITPGGHKDTQELQVPVMRWFNRHLKGEETLIENAAVKLFWPQQLKVFATLPGDALNGKIHETFVEMAKPSLPKSKEEWGQRRESWLAGLRAKSFAGWPQATNDPKLGAGGFMGSSGGRSGGFVFDDGDGAKRFVSYVHYFSQRLQPSSPDKVILLEQGLAKNKRIDQPKDAIVMNVSFREMGQFDAKKQTQLRRREMLVGRTLDGMRVWDWVRLVQAIRNSKELGKLPIRLEAEGDMAVNALYASLFAPVDELVLTNLPKSHQDGGPDYLNVLRILDIPQAVAMASERGRVELRGANEADWQYPLQTAKVLGWEKNLRVVSE